MNGSRRRRGELTAEILKTVAERGALSIYDILKAVAGGDEHNPGFVSKPVERLVNDRLLEYRYVDVGFRKKKLHRLTAFGFMKILRSHAIPKKATAYLAKIIKVNKHLFPELHLHIDKLHRRGFTEEVINVLSDKAKLQILTGIAYMRVLTRDPLRDFEYDFLTFLVENSDKIKRLIRRIPELWSYMLKRIKDEVAADNCIALLHWVQYAGMQLQKTKDEKLEWAIKLNEPELRDKWSIEMKYGILTYPIVNKNGLTWKTVSRKNVEG